MYIIIDYELFVISPILQNNLVIEAMINSCLELVKIDLKFKLNNTKLIENKNKNDTIGFWDWLTKFFFFW
jgi:hypothetical protein